MIKAYAARAQGPREYQQDDYLTLVDSDQTRGKEVKATLVIADGMGGHANGELASQDVVNAILSNLTLREAAITANKKCEDRYDGSGSTMSAFTITLEGNRVQVETIHIGDSQLLIFYYEAGVLNKLFTSIPQETPWGSILNCIGFLELDQIAGSGFDLTLGKDDKLICYLATDGLSDFLDEEIVKSTLRRYCEGEQLDPAKELVELSLITTEDNTTCVIGIVTAD